MKFRGHGRGYCILEFPKARGGGGGFRIWKPPMVGYGYFLESPNPEWFRICFILPTRI